MLNQLVAAVGNWLIKTFPHRTRVIGEDGVPYLTRFYIKHNGLLPGIYLHHFHRSDKDRDLHNHPWRWSCSFVLAGGYYEYRSDAQHALSYLEPEIYERKPLGFNFITGDTFHRVVLKDLRKGAWTVFVSGPEVKNWGFFTGRGFIPHERYIG